MKDNKSCICTCCNKYFERDEHLMLKCCVCGKYYKNTCVDISSSEVRIINANKGYDWSCSNCREIGNDIKSLKALIIGLQEDIQFLKNSKPESRDLFHVSRKKEDEYIVSDILLKILPEFQTNNLKPVRLGRYNQDKIRPIKVPLESEKLVHDVIHKRKALKNTESYKHVSVSFDRTPRQIELYRSVKSQLMDQINSGDKNYHIKYINGIPKIVPLN